MRARVVAALAVVAASVSACGKDDPADRPPQPGAAQLTVYSSLPLQGPAREQSLSIINAEKLALSEAGGRVGPFTVKYVSMDDSKADKGRWDPGTVLSNARRAVEDRTAIAYLGEADSGASAIAIPVLNEAGILTVSPASTYSGLTTAQDADKGEPEKYYPSGQRTFARVVPADDLQARLQVRLQREAGCTTLYVIGDRDVYGRGIAAAVGREADRSGLEVVGQTPLRAGQKEFEDVAKDVLESAADCVFTGLTLNDDAAGLYNAVNVAAPRAKLFGPDALAEDAFAAALSKGAAARTTITSLDHKGDGADVKAFEDAYNERYGQPPGAYAIYGYEAMKAVLAAIKASGNLANRKSVVLKNFFSGGQRDSVLGPYAISADGDTSLDRYVVQVVAGGRMEQREVARASSAG